MKPLDLTGKKFGMLTATKVTHIGKKRAWECKCDCGNIVTIPTFQLTSGNNTSCGCNRSKVKPGQRYGKLVVIKINYDKNNSKKDDRLTAVCKCDCGGEKTTYTRNLTRGSTTHCGCMTHENKGKGRRNKYGESSRKILINSYKHNAKRKGLEFDLSEEELNVLFKGNCHYCGVKPSQIFKKGRSYGEYIYNGIDRLDSNKGYTSENTVSCCSTCNYLKSNYTEKEFLDIIKKIADYRNL